MDDDFEGFVPIGVAARRMALSVGQVEHLAHCGVLRWTDFGDGLYVLPAILSGWRPVESGDGR